MSGTKLSLVEHQCLFLLDVGKLLNYAANLGIMLTGGELYRTKEQQDIYVKQGKSRTTDSNHMRRLAIDLNAFRDGVLLSAKEMEPLGDYWESLHPLNRWGGRFKGLVDGVHFERNV